jgi:hypothetical protein
MARVIVPDDTGHTEFVVETKDELVKELDTRNLNDRWYFVDGNYIDGLRLNEVTLDGIKTIHVIEPLIGG